MYFLIFFETSFDENEAKVSMFDMISDNINSKNGVTKF